MDRAEILETYLRAWRETDGGHIAKRLHDSVSDDVVFVDPLYRTEGRDALAALIADVHATFPGLTVEPAGEPDDHHEVARHGWRILKDGEPLLRGQDVYEFAADGRLDKIIGFYDKV